MTWKCLFYMRKITRLATVAVPGSVVVYETRKSNRRGFAPWINDPDSTNITKWDNDWDRRDNGSLVNTNKDSNHHTDVPTSNRHIFLIRHGQYNVEGEVDKNQGLTNLGKEQALMVGKRLKEYGYKYTRIVSSSLKRAKETTSIIQKSLESVKHEETDLLTEGAPMKPEPPVEWSIDKDPFYQDSVRIEAAFRRFVHRAEPTQKEDSYEIYVCHANVIRYFVIRSLQLPPQAWLRMTLNHGSITCLTVHPTGEVTLRRLGDTGFMPVEFCTTYNFPEDVVD